jgi:hypothetical protein
MTVDVFVNGLLVALKFVNDNSGLFVVIFTLFLVYYNRRLTQETKRIREIDTEPNIEVYLVPHEQSSSFVNMVIRNSGGWSARDIAWTIDCDEENVKMKDIPILSMSLFSVSHYIPAKEEFKFYFGSSSELLKEPKMKPIKIKVNFKNDVGQAKREKEFILDVSPWKGMEFLGEVPLLEISRNIKIISDTLIKSSFNQEAALVRIQSERQYQEEKKSREDIVEAASRRLLKNQKK